ncbi:hypothetical protein BN126_1000 [Cronobacter sakazakii 680]|nr:hypothetical protein BN129_3390 [Cronobacter sakazakii 701]CCK10850.1 hypothetical protein BN126_1000 [Cronobacter sakazakii 680]
MTLEQPPSSNALLQKITFPRVLFIFILLLCRRIAGVSHEI